MPQGAWAEDLWVEKETRTISSNASYDDIEVQSGGFLIISEGVTLTVTSSLYINDDNINGFGTVINYGTIIGEGQINMTGGVLANHGHIDLSGASGHGTFTFYNTGTLGDGDFNLTPTECNHAYYENLGEVDATCTHGAGTQYRCYTCYHMRLDETSGVLPHSFKSHNGMNICSSCGHTTYDEPDNGDGSEEDPYQIANAANLYWFADYTINENNYANAILTADIVLNDGTFATDGTFTATGAVEPSKPFPWIRIGDADGSYSGTFDGNGHTISGMYVNGCFGLFYDLSGSVVNLGIVNCYIRDDSGTGAICHWNYGTISNCYTTGILSGSYGSGICNTNVFDSTISNCYSTCTFVYDSYFDGSGICGTNLGTISNCYTSYDTAIQDNNKTASEVYGGVSADRFASGEIAYKLNGSVDGEGNWTAGATDGTQAWYQKLGENGDSYPVLAAAEGNTVYYGYENCLSESKTYSNDLRYAEKENAHDYQVQLDGNEKPVFVWSEDYATATLQLVCSRDAEHTANVEVTGEGITSADTTPATSTTAGVRTYTAKATYEGETYTGTKEEEIAALGHNYIDGVCQNCGESETQGPIIMTCLDGTSGIGFGEGAASLIDGDDDTKWCSNWYADNKPYIIFKTNVPAKLTGYNMVHGNDTPDNPGRAWATWTIYGANFDSDSQATAVSTAWKEVDKHSGYSFDSDYSFSNLTNLQYQYYKIVVDEVPNNNLQQMAEIHFTFLACNHKGIFTEHPATEATAEAHGNAAYKTCDICGACFDADGQEITASVIHYFDDEHTHAAKDPSCTQVGNKAYKECAVCQAIFDMDGNPIDSYEVPMSDHSYDSEGKCITCDQKLPLLSLGSNTIDIEEGYTIFYFMAPQDATYIFETTGDEDTYGAILSTDGETIINEDDDCGNGQNFRLSYEMSAGSIVTLRVTQYAYKAIPGYTLVIRIHNHEWRDGVCAECHKICDHSDMEDLGHSDATCTQPAGTSRKCNICSFTEFTPDPESSALGHNVVDGVCTRCEKPMAIAVTIGSDTHQFIDFDEALPVALDAPSATVTLLTDVTLPKDKDLFFDRGNITLDLNGKKISGNGIRIVYLLGGNLTITDNTADKKGVIENTTNGGDGISSAVVWVDLGALVIHAGTFCSKSELALYANQHNQEFINVTIDGGRFVSLEGGAAISTVYKSSLAEGYAYYKTGTDEEIEEQLDTPISEYDITVLPMSIKAIVTVGETTTEYNTFKAAFYAAMAAFGEVTVKLLADVTLTDGENILARDYHNDSKDDVILTLDLNGHNITGKNSQADIPVTSITLKITDSSNDMTGSINCCDLWVNKSDIYVAEGVTLRAAQWDWDLVVLQGESSLENHGILYGNVVYGSGTAFYNYGLVAYAQNMGGDFENGGSFIPIWSWDTDWETDEIYCEVYINNEKLYSSKNGTVELSSEVTKAPTCTESGERTYTAAIEYVGKTYTDTYSAYIDIDPEAHDFTSKTLTAEPDEHGLYAYACDREGCEGHSDYNVVKGNGEGNNIELIATTDSETGITTYSAESVIIEDGKPFYSPVEFTTTDVDMGRQFTQSIGDAVVPATIMLPFRMYAGEVSTVNPQGVRTGTKFYSFTSLDYNSYNDRWEANMDIVIDDLEAYTPYMVVLTDGEEIPFGNAPVTFTQTPAEMNNISSSDGEWSFVATNEAKVWTAADFGHGEAYYGFAAGNETTPEGKFVKVGTGASIDPLRAYIMKNVQTRGSASNAPSRALTASQLPSTIGVRLNETYATGIGTLNTETGEGTFEGG